MSTMVEQKEVIPTNLNITKNKAEMRLNKKIENRKSFKRSKYLLILFLPCLIYYIVFKYLPMWGVVISFFDYSIFKGLELDSFVGLQHFITFFENPDAMRAVKNTIILGVESLIIGFPMPILFALLLNEVVGLKRKKIIQTISYLPHFLSAVVVCGMINSFLSPIGGPINNIIEMFGGESINFLAEAQYFRPIYIVSAVWQEVGWGAIIYMAALAGIDVGLYEASAIDGANRWKQTLHITLPCMAPTIITMLLLKIGSLLTVGLEKVLILQKPVIYSTADVLDTYVYRQGIIEGNISYATAVGLFNSVVCFVLLFGANFVTKKFSESSLF